MHLAPRAAALALLLASSAAAQTYYRNLDAGQPGRVEDAEVTAQYSLGFYVSPLQFEHLAGGTARYRAEPKLAYGILPFTELEIRVPLVELVPPAASGAASYSGVAGVTVGLTRAFNVETRNVPAVAITGEASLPVGSLAGAQGSFFFKALATKTAGPLRLHLNAGAGTYSVGSPRTGGTGCQSITVVGTDTTCGPGPIIIFDAPCSVGHVGSRPGAAAAARMCERQPADSTSTTASPAVTTNGKRWFAGLAVDHAFPLQSTLVSADIFAERFVGLYPIADWTAEAGLRHQLTPIIVVNLGAGRHFAGTVPSTFVLGGVSFEFATPPLLGR